MKIASLSSVLRRIFRIVMLEPDFHFQHPIVVVLGATGAGKSKLAMEIASKYSGEIINADSMQIYKRLDIATNKVTPEELAKVPHHMLGFLDPLRTYTVVDFCNSTLPLISKLHSEKKLPVIVGGTHYYVESLLWNVLIQPSEKSNKISDSSVPSESDVASRISEIMKYVAENNPKENVNVCSENLDKMQEYVSVRLSENISECNKSDFILESKSDIKKCDSEICDKPSEGVFDLVDDLNQIREKMDYLSNEELWHILSIVDPEIAAINHPNNRRKVLRSLEVWVQTGVRHSEHLRRQREEVGVDDLGGRIRFRNVAVLWVTCDQETLDKRLDNRVDAMLKEGLIEELSDFHTSYNAPLIQKCQEQQKTQGSGSSSTKTSVPCDVDEHYKKGIFQCIGLKEFHDFLCLQQDERESTPGKKLFSEGIENMKLRTRQYSRRQIKWIRNRFLLRDRKKIPVYAVDGSDPSQWDLKVSRVAEEVVSSVIAGRIPTTQPISVEAKKLKLGDKTRHTCEICNRVFIGEVQWKQHLNGAKHRKVVQNRRKAEALEVEVMRKSHKTV